MNRLEEVAKEVSQDAINQQQAALQHQQQMHHSQIRYMQEQVLWMTAVAGEERMTKAFNDPQFQERIAEDTAVLRKVMETQQGQASGQ